MSDKIWTVIYIVLGCIAVMMLLWAMMSMNKTSMVDCNRPSMDGNGVDYKPLPKQCEKGE